MPHKEEGTEFLPECYPPFPDNLPCSELQTISLRKLLDHDELEENRAFEAFKGKGFVYLQLQGAENGETILSGAHDLGCLASAVFALPLEEKTKYMPKNKELFGYKTKGATITSPDGTRDTAEFMNVSRDDMLAADEDMDRAWPRVILENKPLLTKYSRAAHSIGLMIMGILAQKLGIPVQEINDRHLLTDHSGDHIRLTRGPPRATAEMPEVQTPSHTDFGTITILMNMGLGGLQMWSESSRKIGALEPDVPGEWLWVKPKKDCAVVNLGDAAVKYSGGTLCSGRHRVVPAPGEQGKWPRYSIVYFVRPANDSRLKTLKGAGVPPAEDEDEEGVLAKDWIFQQSLGLGFNHFLDN